MLRQGIQYATPKSMAFSRAFGGRSPRSQYFHVQYHLRNRKKKSQWLHETKWLVLTLLFYHKQLKDSTSCLNTEWANLYGRHMVEAEMLSGYEKLEMKNTPLHFGLGWGGSASKLKNSAYVLVFQHTSRCFDTVVKNAFPFCIYYIIIFIQKEKNSAQKFSGVKVHNY